MKLIYFDIPGKAEAIRLCAAVGGVQLDDVRISREKFHEMRDSGELPFGQVPALDVGDGRILAQSSAILRYVATLGGLHPTDPLEAAHVDAVAAAEEDFFAGISVSRYGARFGFEMSDEYRAQVRKALNDEVLPRHLSALQKKLEASKTGWLAGTEKPSIADFVFSPRLRWLVGGANDGIDPGLLEGYPAVTALLEKFYALPEVVKWYEQPDGEELRAEEMYSPKGN
jgi:prostaglandin-H2 D-isomerase / glutathione transferase